MANTTAQQVADMLNNNGMNWRTNDGRHFDDVMKELDAQVSYARRHAVESETLGGDAEEEWVDVNPRDISDAVRFEFDDGSAIVSYHNCWDIEKHGAPFDMEGA